VADVVDGPTRSRMMAGIRGKDTKPELQLRKALHAQGLRFRLHDALLPGRPDLVLPRWRAAVFVHGCFWHRHDGCRFATIPATRPEFWAAKFQANVERDSRNVEELARQNWRVATVWECALRKNGAEAAAIDLKQWLLNPSDETRLSIP
jgi:DNA mismatch endonuclease (patch repair protein)